MKNSKSGFRLRKTKSGSMVVVGPTVGTTEKRATVVVRRVMDGTKKKSVYNVEKAPGVGQEKVATERVMRGGDKQYAGHRVAGIVDGVRILEPAVKSRLSDEEIRAAFMAARARTVVYSD